MHEQPIIANTQFTRRQVLAVAAAGCAGAAITATPEASARTVTKPEEPRRLRVAGLLIQRRPFDCEGNAAEFEELAARVSEGGAQLLVTPEGFVEGYIIQTEGLARDRYAEVAQAVPGGRYYERVRETAVRHGVYVAAGMAEKEGERFYNTSALIGPDGTLIGKYRKSHTLSDEPLNTRGGSFPVFDTPIGRIGIMICYDRQPPETARLLTLHGADIILNPAAGSYGETNTMMMRTRAYENGVPIVFAHFAECLLIDRKGGLIARYAEGGQRAVVADVEIGRGKSTIDYRRPEIYADLSDPSLKPRRV